MILDITRIGRTVFSYLVQYEKLVHFSRVVLRLQWVVELFRVVGTTENILLVFCRLGDSRISSFRKKSFQFTCFKWEGSEICKLCLISSQIYAFNPLEPLQVVTNFYLKLSSYLNKLSCLYAEFRLTAEEKRNHAGNLLSLRTWKVSMFVRTD